MILEDEIDIESPIGIIGTSYYTPGGVMFCNNPFDYAYMNEKQFVSLLDSGIYTDLMVNNEITLTDIFNGSISDLDLIVYNNSDSSKSKLRLSKCLDMINQELIRHVYGVAENIDGLLHQIITDLDVKERDLDNIILLENELDSDIDSNEEDKKL